ncbi:hypothetical protein [Methylobacterium sp. 285MFTsu5.1]|uniref:DUF6894 family protein n=1 Tax=Methylobacterium sp. 285MFTsu5.1 TaxID=1172187 RepID=UPI00131A091A|nr:hypothetical protein [Methylobacterium sp. 285MFTsu5.1]
MRYFFDVHAGSLSDWDDVGIFVKDLDDAVSHATYMLAVVLGDIDRLGGDRHAVIMIRDSSGIPIATVKGHGREEPRVIFSLRR